MHLERVWAKHLRPYESLDVCLSAESLTLLAGANNVGKSAALFAFDVVAGVTVPSLQRVGSDARPRVGATFKTTREERLALFAAFEDSESWAAAGGFDAIEFEFREFARGTEAFVVMTSASTNLGRRPFAVVKLDSEDGWQARFRVANWDAIKKADPYGADALPFMQTEMQLDQSRSHYLGPIESMLQQWRESYFHFSEVRPGTSRTTKLDSVAKLASDGTNLNAVLLHLQSNEGPKFDLVQKAISEIVPDAGNLVVRTGAGESQAAFHDPLTGADTNIKDLGSGVEQALLATIVAVAQRPGGLTILEEPETGLHPGAQRELARLMRKWSKDQQLIATTHSPTILGLDGSSSKTLLVTRRGNSSKVVEATLEPAPLLRELGVRLSDLMSAERLLLVEGETDRLILREWFADELDSAGIAVVSLGGSDRVFDVKTVDQVLNEAGALAQPILVIRDRDELSPEQIERLSTLPDLRLLDRREIENFLLVPHAINAQLEALGVNDPDVTDAELDEVTDSQRPVVLLKRITARLPPYRLVDRTLVSRVISEGAELASLRAAVMERIPIARAVGLQLDEIAKEEESKLAEEWPNSSRLLAPGEEVLSILFARRERAFKKFRDGSGIAAQMSKPPAELRAFIEELAARTVNLGSRLPR